MSSAKHIFPNVRLHLSSRCKPVFMCSSRSFPQAESCKRPYIFLACLLMRVLVRPHMPQLPGCACLSQCASVNMKVEFYLAFPDLLSHTLTAPAAMAWTQAGCFIKTVTVSPWLVSGKAASQPATCLALKDQSAALLLSC